MRSVSVDEFVHSSKYEISALMLTTAGPCRSHFPHFLNFYLYPPLPLSGSRCVFRNRILLPKLKMGLSAQHSTHGSICVAVCERGEGGNEGKKEAEKGIVGGLNMKMMKVKIERSGGGE